ncbi:HAMP domain-containing sensor histidine kinase [Sphingomonas sp. SUN039]|uniref:sensor histidine kinase n=1 Tax=Sphingomonas sp. SUN039 TaxID=2937787 RepID=UPI002164AB8A|nr:HAMP domain-containing sensor histidine kinase [Sphingomonas sp. SUN039]UVO53238.1 HAMP domain-containing histidine kinase [Sphingomonas sp. SUN039]
MSGRFDTMLTTAMRLADGDAGARAASWRQIVDIVAQAGTALDHDARGAAFERLAALRDMVPVADRRMTAASLAGRTADPALAVLFARDEPAVAAPFLARADLGPVDWQQAIPSMPAAARNILRNRRDLPEAAVTMLGRFAAADLTLPPSTVAAKVDEAAPGVTQIRELVDRIAAYRQRVPMPQAGDPDLGEPVSGEPQVGQGDAGHSDGFVFETMPDGTIDWIDGASREAIVGMSIADAATFGIAGVDGQAAGAWRRRAPFHDARLVVAGLGGAGGDWLISGAPLFNPADGRFCGYRGTARRPRQDERADGPSRVGGIAPDSLRQLVHELRTPLNAIQGFAEMIDKQMLGPAALRYRERARTIMSEAERLVAMVDDLDTSARLDSGRLAADAPDEADVAGIAARVCAQHRPTLSARGVDLAMRGPAFAAPVAAASTLVERMIARLLAAASAVATPGESVSADVEARAADVVFAVSRPAALAGREEATLLDPGYGPDGDWPDAPLLGLGFTLRLVARLAAQAGGSLVILPDRFALALPAVAARAEVQPA